MAKKRRRPPPKRRPRRVSQRQLGRKLDRELDKEISRRVPGSGRSRRRSRSKGRRIVWRTVKGTTRGTWRLGRKYVPKAYHGSKVAYGKWAKDRKFETGYEPEPGEIPGRKFTRRTTYACCGRRFATPEALNEHHVRIHDGENPAKVVRAQPTLRISKTARSAGKRTVEPVAGVPSGRHRAGAGSANRVRVEALIQAHRERLDEIGRTAMADESNVAHQVARGFRALGEERPRGLKGIEALALGMEQASAVGADAVAEIRAHLVRLGIERGHMPHLAKVIEDYQQAASHWTAFIETLKSELAPEIVAAKQRAAGERPADGVLLG